MARVTKAQTPANIQLGNNVEDRRILTCLDIIISLNFAHYLN